MRLIKFHADWCAPCKAIAPQVDKLVEEKGWHYESYDVDEEGEVAAYARVRSVPTLILEDSNGVELTRTIGSNAVTDLLDKLPDLGL